MSREKNNCTRRDFLKKAGAAGLGSVVAAAGTVTNPSGTYAEDKPQHDTMPTRPFGKTGVNVPILALGGIVDFTSSQILLRQALKAGVTYWDTAESYEGGKSEEGIGKYFSRYPQDREKVFLVTKAGSHDLDGMTRGLEKSLSRLKTSYIDLYFMHGIRTTRSLHPYRESRAWVEKAKKEGKIRFFGFSTHSFMEDVMLEASKLGWIDGIMMTYNYRLMHSDRMKAAVDACVKAGIGLTAMKTQASRSWGPLGEDSQASKDMAERFLEKGFTPEQAKLKAVWENPGIASICSHMPSLTILMANVSAARNRTSLTSKDVNYLKEYAVETAGHYCTGCANICESAVGGSVPINNIMRYIMYCRSYGDRHRARSLFNEIPAHIRNNLAKVDYSEAEKRCPQGMLIGEIISGALKEMA